SGALKNALDWISRLRPAPMAGTPVAVVSAAAGVAGGQRAKSLMYLLLVPFKCELVFNPEVNLGTARDKFDANGRLTDEAAEKFLGQLMDALKAKV
ncbi:MAG: NAD(P)H-dependent oxidoreductase, partial [Pseudomonadota bacterium]